MVKRFVERHPFLLSLLLALASFGMAAFSISASRKPVVSDVQDVDPANLVPPTEGEQAFVIAWSGENLFWALIIVVSVGLFAWFGWRREAGFGWPPKARNLRLLAFPALVGVLAFLGGTEFPGVLIVLAIVLTVLVTTFGEEAFFRGLMFRALAPSGLLRAAAVTALLAGSLRFGASMLTNPWPEAVQAAILATCGGFTYAALRWRTASIWPGLLVHVFISFSLAISDLAAPVYLVLLLLSTLGFVAYGFFLLRNQGVRADGGPPLHQPSQVA